MFFIIQFSIMYVSTTTSLQGKSLQQWTFTWNLLEVLEALNLQVFPEAPLVQDYPEAKNNNDVIIIIIQVSH